MYNSGAYIYTKKQFMEKVNVKAKCANQRVTLLHCYHLIVLNKNTYSEL